MSRYNSAWLIIPQTNLHVGNESIISYSVIDKAIQRDASTAIPCINSSSLKGAVKEFLNGRVGDNIIKDLFGSIKNNPETQKGRATFFDANLLFIPAPCADGSATYKLNFSKDVLNSFAEKLVALGIAQDKVTVLNRINQVVGPSVEKSLNKFMDLVSDDSLPIIARNCLENGESTNLWYEQVLPSQSVLGTIIKSDVDCPELDETLMNGVVQIGANATIGYGYCKFIKLF